MSADINADDSAAPLAGVQEGDQADSTVEQLRTRLAQAEQQSKQYSVALHTLTKRLDKFESAARAVPDIEEHLTTNGAKAKPNAAVKEDQSLRERLERIEAREQSQKEREKLSAIRNALESHEIDGAQAKRLSRLIAMEQAERIAVDDDLRVTIDDAGQSRDVHEWMSDYLQTDDGRLLIPAKRTTRNNSAAISSGSSNGKTKVTANEYGRLSIAEIKSGNFEISG